MCEECVKRQAGEPDAPAVLLRDACSSPTPPPPHVQHDPLLVVVFPSPRQAYVVNEDFLRTAFFVCGIASIVELCVGSLFPETLTRYGYP